MAGALAGLALAGPAMAAHPEFFLGAGAGRYDINDDRFDEDDTAWKLYAGFDFNPVVGLEFSWVDFNEAREPGTSFDTDGWGAALVLSLPLTQNFSLYGKGGQFFWNTDGTELGVPVSRDGDDPFWGAGAKFRLNEVLDLRLEGERYEISDTDFDTVMIMLQASF
jgi:hypothetical protein